MFSRLVPINAHHHAAIRVRPTHDYAFAARTQLLGLMMAEMPLASACYPIAFVRPSSADIPRPVALLGLSPGENLFVSDSGAWSAPYVPALARRYPFALARSAVEDTLVVCIDEGSPLVSASRGAPLFRDDGQPAAALEKAKQFLLAIHQAESRTEAFTRVLLQHGLLVPLRIRHGADVEAREVAGALVIDETRLDALPIAALDELRSQGFLPAIYAHLRSILLLAQLFRLRTLATERPAGSVVLH